MSLSLYILSGLFLCFLIIGAAYDMHGTLVPDDATVPYASLGLAASALSGRWFTFGLGCILLLLVLFGRKPKWLSRIGEKMLKRSYESEETMDSFAQEQEEKAEIFESRFGKRLHILLFILSVAVFVVPILHILLSGSDVLAGVSSTLAFFTALFSFFYLYMSKKAEPAIEEMSAFGGADALVLIGLFGYYGGVAFVYALLVTFLVYAIWVVAEHFIRGKKEWGGSAMLPVVLVTAPLRYWAVNHLFAELISASAFSFSDLQNLKYLFVAG